MKCVSVKKITAIIILTVLMTFCALSVFAAENRIVLRSKDLPEYSKYAPKENVFCIENHEDKSFIMLDSDKEGFLIMANGNYAIKSFDPDGTQMFDLFDENNIAYWLNNVMPNTKDLLPDEIKKYVDHTRVWKTEAGNKNGNCPNDYETVCGYSLLSYTEFMKYYKKIGVQDDNYRKDWFLRSPLGSEGAVDTAVSVGGTFDTWGKLVPISTKIELGIRPVFWINKDFFRDVKMSFPFIGEEVKKAVVKAFTLEEFQNGKVAHDDYAAKRMGYKIAGMYNEHINVFFPNAPIYAQNQKDAYVDVDISITGNEKKIYKAEYSLDGTFDDAVSVTREILPYKKENIKLDLSMVKKGKYEKFSVRVISDEGILEWKTAPVTIMEFVSIEPLAEYSRIGINWHADTMTSNEDRGVETENYNKIFNMMGITNTRSIHRWKYTETTKGNRPNGRHRTISTMMEEYDLKFAPYILGMGNPVYFPGDPKTQKNVADLVNYCTDISDYLAKMGVKIEMFEIWNEPNLTGFWGSESWITYPQAAHRVAYTMDNIYPDIPIFGGAVSATGSNNTTGLDYLDNYFRRGAYMYVDGYSIHPYTYPTNPDKRHYTRSKGYVDKRDLYGGWLEVAMTEAGYPTHNGTTGVDRDIQALYIPKMFIYNDELDICMTDLYTFADMGWNDTDREDNFGIVDFAFVPKQAVVSIAQLNKYCANANYVGRFPIDEASYAYVYTKLDKIFAVLWLTDEEKTMDYSIEASVKAEDLYGNSIEANNGKITLSSNIVYLSNLSDDYIKKATNYQSKTEVEAIKNDFSDKTDLSGLDDAISEFSKAENITPSSLKKGVEDIYNYGSRLIDEYKNSENMQLKDLSVILSKLNRIAKRALFAYAHYDFSGESSNKTFDEVRKKIEDKKGTEPESSLLYTDALMRFAEKYNKRANDIAKNYKEKLAGKNGVKTAYDSMAINVSKWSEKLMDLEEADTSRAIFTYLEKTNVTVYHGQKFEFKMEVENLRNKDINGTVVWRDASERTIGDEYPCIIKSGECKNVTFGGTVPADIKFGKHVFYVDIIEDGKLLKRSEIDTNVGQKLSAELIDSTEPVSLMTNVSIQLKNTFNEKFMGTVEIEAPDDWEFKENSKRFVIDAGEVKNIDFEISSKSTVPYNEYFLKFIVKDHEDNILIEKGQMLDFLVVPKAEKEIDIESFDGDITGWENAYPIHINSPENPLNQSEWKNSNLAVKSLMKWDDNYFYILTDVYDNMYTQNYVTSNIWQGDSIQIAFDTLDNASDGELYGDDDYEYGVSVTNNGTEVYGFKVASVNSAGIKPSSWAKVIRDDHNKITRYLFKIPKADIAPLDLYQGKKFAFNLCANDADVLERDNVIEFTPGTNGRKQPANFKTFILAGQEKPIRLEDGKEYSFITKINDDGFQDANK